MSEGGGGNFDKITKSKVRRTADKNFYNEVQSAFGKEEKKLKIRNRIEEVLKAMYQATLGEDKTEKTE